MRDFYYLPSIYSLVPLLLWPTSLTFGYINYIEIITTTTPNEPFLNVYYFWWTNLTYIFNFFINFILLNFIWLIPTNLYTVTLQLIGFEYLWFSELRYFLTTNSQLFSFTTLNSAINLLLTNTLNKYHPFLFYFSLVLLLRLLIQIWNGFMSQLLFVWKKNLIHISTPPFFIYFLLTFTLFLGSWWALQEGTWGGWWNWDVSEVFGLLPILFLLRCYHSSNSLNTFWNFILTVYLFSSIIIGFYLLLQLNFDFISHNFGSKFFFFFNSQLFYYNVLLLLLFLNLWSWFLFQKLLIVFEYCRIRNKKSPLTYNSIPSTRFVPLVILCEWIYLSCTTLITTSWLILQHITWLNWMFSFFYLNLILFISLLILLIAPAIKSYWYVFGMSWTVLSTPQRLFLNNPTINFHLNLVLFTYLNLLIYPLTIYFWFITPDNGSCYTNSWISFTTPFFYINDSWNVDRVSMYFNSDWSTNNTWTTKNTTNTFIVDQFFLLTTPTFLSNYFVLAIVNLTPYLHMEILLLPSITIIFLLMIYQFQKLTIY